MHRSIAVMCLAACGLFGADGGLGLFERSGDVGETPKKGSSQFDAAKGEYRITGGGANIWAAADAFQFAWKKLSGDFAISADIRFEGAGAVGHRKATLMIRQSLDAASAYADAAAHGDGLTSLQFRPAANGQTLEVRSDLKGPVRLRIERRGDQFMMYAGNPGEELKPSGPAPVALTDPVYVGLAVCSHDANILETAVFSNVTIESLLKDSTLRPPFRPRITGVAHIGLFAHDYEKSRAFYRDFLGFEEPYDLKNPDGTPSMTFFKVNERQYIELFVEKEPNSDRLNHISVETDDVEGLRRYLASRGVAAPEKAGIGRIKNQSFTIQDPDGHGVEFVQYMPDGWTIREKGQAMPATRISKRIMHVGVIVTKLDPAMQFYRDTLGFEETWRGSSNEKQLSWINLRVPDGQDYVELMLYKDAPEPTKRGSAHHLALEVPDIAAATAELEAKPYRKQYTRALEPKVGINRKRQLNLFDPDGTRTELMELATIDGKPTPPSTAPPPDSIDSEGWIDLMPDITLHGWTRIPIPPIAGVQPKLQWRVDRAQHTLICHGDGGHEWLRYDRELGDYLLRVDWRFTPVSPGEKRYNSGIGIRLSKYGEIWTQAQTGLAGGYLFGENFADGTIQRFNLSKEMKENRVKPAGDWNRYEIRVQGDKITLTVNGMVVNELSGVGLRRGYIGLEAEGYDITFRNLAMKPLD
jgi:lactoylglutathione lyase